MLVLMDEGAEEWEDFFVDVVFLESLHPLVLTLHIRNQLLQSIADSMDLEFFQLCHLILLILFKHYDHLFYKEASQLSSYEQGQVELIHHLGVLDGANELVEAMIVAFSPLIDLQDRADLLHEVRHLVALSGHMLQNGVEVLLAVKNIFYSSIDLDFTFGIYPVLFVAHDRQGGTHISLKNLLLHSGDDRIPNEF